jgi:formylglycine-generating enzyme required for sulfatase activity
MINRPLRVFLCHSSADKPAVRDLYEKLTARGIDAWLDEKKLLPGQSWKIEIPKAVREADAVIICLSKTSITKEGYVQKEIKDALDIALEKPEGTIYLIPARLEECEAPSSLSDWHWVNLFDKQGMISLFKSLEVRAVSLGLDLKQPDSRLVDDNLLFDEAVKVAREQGQVSVSMLQRRLRIGYTRSSRILDKMKDKGIVVLPKKETQIYQVLDAQSTSGESTISRPSKITLSNGMEFMRVPAGRFLMGEEKEQHTVDIPYDYWMARFPVTNEQYNVYAIAKGFDHPVSDWKKKRDHPVTRINWDTTMEYCKWLNNQIKAELPSGMIARLPTEAEWEKAARGPSTGSGDRRKYPWGNTFDKNKCNSSEGRKDDTTPVGLYSPQGDSPYGCADMAGNVWEWTCSRYKKYPFDVKNTVAKASDNDWLVLRGGSWRVEKDRTCVSSRLGYSPDSTWYFYGFRLLLAPLSTLL